MTKRFDEYLNEELFNKMVSFPINKMSTFSRIRKFTDRVNFKVVDINDGVLCLEKGDESMCIDDDCKITNHMKNGHEMRQTYDCDNITKAQVKKALA